MKDHSLAVQLEKTKTLICEYDLVTVVLNLWVTLLGLT